MTNYAQELRRCQVVLLLRAAIDAGGNLGVAAKAAGVHRNTICRVLRGAGYDSARVKKMARSAQSCKAIATAEVAAASIRRAA